MRITWLGHSSVVLDLDGVRVLTDPLLRPHAGLLRRIAPRPDPASWSGADVVLLSHLHHDHAELRSLRMLGGAAVMSAPANVVWLRRRTQLPGVPLGDGWTPVGSGGVEVRQVPAEHRHRPMPHRPNDAHGQLVRGPSGVVWIAGDTGLFPEMAELPAMAGGAIDVALVPVWGWGPRLSAGHLSPETAARAAALSGARYALPVHWGTLHPPFVTRFARGWLEHPGRRFALAVAEQAPGCTAVVLAPGQSWVAPE
ncbi:L-ascorbate metabolism protein UlaG (beta-lactamase superfamily) [Arthrobacter ginsengisoli]|uniref:L-ascorbate metabolism protein UlaG (Beta-lactamase superfamily) n=1 Tax=Arthrobacter ginsengisoli TaxID=1356565 RepID=A0ABU1UFV6_9MICC|nr:MBL fold metallo-hydrolase [Arthrobacter ginsengisoli]MDR7084078.1 L-ascorbate metabolism protein UlaG (beta-lactamase superfamily) [Arthrobacter ginsengisoli]